MKKTIIISLILISVILCVPSLIYLFNNKTVDGFDAYYTYTLTKSETPAIGFLSGVLIIGLLLIFSFLYFILIKKEAIVFKNRNKIWIFIIIISFIFTLILPYLSSDIYYYIGDSWLSAKYNENPYYTSVGQLQETGINDEILNNTGYWKNTTSVYGPLWNFISKILVSLSFGNVTIALFIFKIASFLIHILNTFLILKLTKSNKYMLMYGINPLILIEFLSNVHNNIYLILFILLTLYFLIKKKNIWPVILFLALSISIKYSTALLVPFILIYYFKNKTIPKRILYCIISGLLIVALVILLYLPYFRDFTIFTNMLVQGEKYSQSLMSVLLKKLPNNIFSIISNLLIPTFLVIYITILIIILFNKKVTFKEIMKKYNFVMLLFIFIVLTTFQKWYILWLFPTIIWQNKNMRKLFLYMTILSLMPSLKYFEAGVDAFSLGMTYSIKIIILSFSILTINILFNKYLSRRKLS